MLRAKVNKKHPPGVVIRRAGEGQMAATEMKW